MDHSPPGPSIHGILQARILKWVAISSSRGSSGPRDLTCVSYISCIVRRSLYCWCHFGSPVTVYEASIKTQKDWVSGLVSTWRFRESYPQSEPGSSEPFLIPSPMPLFYLAIPKLHPFTTDQWSLLECCSEFYDVSSKLIEPNSGGGGGLLEPPIYSQLVRSTDDNLDS